MAFIHGKDTEVFFNNNDFGQYFNSIDFTRTADVSETTAFGNSAKSYVSGDKDGTVSMSGFFDATSDAILQPFLGSATNTDLLIGLNGTTDGKSVLFGSGIVTNYGQSSPVGDVVATSVDMQADDGFFNGLVVDKATITTTGNSTALDNTTSSTNGGGAFAIVTAVSGTSTPTATIKIQHSADDTTYVDLVTFTNFTAVGSQMETVASGTTINRYLRVNYTISGTNPSFACIVGFGRTG
tara:strand:- start:2797 stop:3513 length:717 start_codon:yes stop_codon:yes gene_type:complete